ncbi:MAG: nucleotide sugar dehydrogenase [Candidatus Heimdallarchaeota archaeon]
MNVGIIGSGYVGFSLARLFASRGKQVICLDVVPERVDEINTSNLENIHATLDVNETVLKSDILFIAVPTPSKEDGSVDLKYIKMASKNIGKALKDKSEYCVVVMKSTVVPKTTEDIVIPILEQESGKKTGQDFGVCMNPEFITQIHSSWTKDDAFKRDWGSEDKIVIGELDQKSGDTLEALYQPTQIKIFRTDLRTAELVKYASNACLAARISFFNEIFLLSKELGIDSQLIADALAADKRIGKYGTIHGMAYGGSCFPKDISAIIQWAKAVRDVPFLKAIKKVNDEIREEYGVRE